MNYTAQYKIGDKKFKVFGDMIITYTISSIEFTPTAVVYTVHSSFMEKDEQVREDVFESAYLNQCQLAHELIKCWCKATDHEDFNRDFYKELDDLFTWELGADYAKQG